MMILAHDSDRYGYLSQNGAAMPPEHIARRCGTPLDQYATLLAELDHAGVPSRTPDGIIFSRRMVRDARARESSRERVKKHRLRSNGTCNGHVTPLYEDEVEDEVTTSGERKERERTIGGEVSAEFAVMRPAYEREMAFHKDARAVVVYLREATGKPFSESGYNLALISRRMREHEATFEEVKKMIDRQARLWKKDPEKQEWLRVNTLFGEAKFGDYYASRNVQPPRKGPNI